MSLFDEKLISQKEVLEMSGVSRNTLFRDIKNGVIRCVKITGKINRFYESEAIAYAESKKKRGRSEKWKKEKLYKET